MLAYVTTEEFIDFTLKIVESSMMLMRKKTESSDKPVTQHVFIFDLEGFSLLVRIYLNILNFNFYIKTATHGPTIEILQRLISVYEGEIIELKYK